AILDQAGPRSSGGGFRPRPLPTVRSAVQPEGEVVLGASPPARPTHRIRFDELVARLNEIADLGKAGALLSWDQHTMMPPRGAAARAEQLATVGRIAH